jgi:hypothetical protein
MKRKAIPSLLVAMLLAGQVQAGPPALERGKSPPILIAGTPGKTPSARKAEIGRRVFWLALGLSGRESRR